MTEPFLARIAREVSDACGDDPTAFAVVLPSRRAAVYFRKHFAACSPGARFAPQMLTLDQFVAQLTPLKPGDRIELLFRLYRSHQEVWQTEAEPFDRFLKWGTTALSDFSELDAYLVDPKAFFRDLTNLKELDAWSLNEEELTATQQQYAWFWKQLGALYRHFNAQLRAEGMAYTGMYFRDAAENIEERAHQVAYERVYFCGFNALSGSEERIMQHFVACGKGEIRWDADRFYLDYPQHEAGKFLRRNFKSAETPVKWLTDDLTTTKKKITMVAAPNEVAQADYMAKVLSETNDHSGTAVVLANPGLLLPALNALPDTVENANVTMGLSTRHSPLHSLFDLLFEWINARRADGRYHYRHAARMLSHPYLNFDAAASKGIHALIAKINAENKVFLDLDWISNHCQYPPLVALFTSISIQAPTATDQLRAQFGLIDFIVKSMGTAGAFPIEKEYVYHYLRVLRRIEQLVQRFPSELGGEAYARIFSALSAGEKLNFVGEPLGGLQVMGMLETRALDFDRLVILSCNERVMPGTATDQSLIPYELKKFYQLPTQQEREAIYGYYFYRLLQRASDIHLTYSTDANDWHGTEPSRYIAQINHDLKDQEAITLKSTVTVAQERGQSVPAVSVEKDAAVRSGLRQKLETGLSPSALNSYIQCPLDFYYTYVIGYREADEVEETIEHATLGSAVHAVLEELYKPHKRNGILKTEHIEAMLPKVRELTRQSFDEHYSSESMAFGMNNLIFEVAIKFIQRFLAAEIQELKALEKRGKHVEIIDLEKPLELVLDVPLGDETVKVKLKGNADRIDKVGDTVRVIDYKTGKVVAKDVALKDPETSLQKPEKAKALQLLMYGFMYYHSAHPKELVAGNISMRNLREFLLPVKWEEEETLNATHWQGFENQLRQILADILSAGEPLAHREEAKFCTFCDTDHDMG